MKGILIFSVCAALGATTPFVVKKIVTPTTVIDNYFVYEEGLDDGYNDGYEDGTAAGYEEGYHAALEQIACEQREAKEAFEQLERNSLMKQVRDVTEAF